MSLAIGIGAAACFGLSYYDALYEKMKLALEDFSDVNAAEKELMHMWNKHILQHPVLTDSQVYLTCRSFICIHIRELLPLKNNLRLHLATLYDYGVLSSKQVYELCLYFDEQSEADGIPVVDGQRRMHRSAGKGGYADRLAQEGTLAD